MRESHAPGHLRDAFCKALETFRGDIAVAFGTPELIEFTNADREHEWYAKTGRERAIWLLERLQDCRDILPGDCRQIMEDRFPDAAPSTYRSAARLLMGHQLVSDKLKWVGKIEQLILKYGEIPLSPDDSAFKGRFYEFQAGCIDLLQMLGSRGEHWRSIFTADVSTDADAPIKMVSCLEIMKTVINKEW